jgi:hypothetical protein
MRHPDKIESKFLVPLKGDISLGSGRLHPADKWKWLQDELIKKFEGYTPYLTGPGPWKDPQTGIVTYDECREYYVDINENQMEVMEKLLKEVAGRFQQKCIRFVCKGEVYYIPNKELL